MRVKKRKLLLSEATPMMLLVLSLTFLVTSVIAYTIAKLIGIILAALCVGAIYFYVKYSRVQRSLKEAPMVTSSKVISKSKSEHSDWESEFYSYKIIIEFTPIMSTGTSEAMRLEVEVSESFANRYKEDDIVPILYSQVDPRFAMLKGERQIWHSYWPE